MEQHTNHTNKETGSSLNLNFGQKSKAAKAAVTLEQETELAEKLLANLSPKNPPAQRGSALAKEVLLEKLEKEPADDPQVLFAAAKAFLSVAPKLKFSPAVAVRLSEHVARDKDLLLQHEEVVTALGEQLPYLPPAEGSKVFNALFSNSVPDYLLDVIGSDDFRKLTWNRGKASFWQEFRNISTEAAKNLFDAHWKGHGMGKHERLEWVEKNILTRPEAIVEEGRLALLQHFAKELLKRRWLYTLAGPELRKHFCKEDVLGSLDVEEVAKCYAYYGFPWQAGDKLIPLLPQKFHNPILKAILASPAANYLAKTRVPHLRHLDLQIFADHAKQSLAGVTSLLDHFSNFRISAEGTLKVAETLEQNGGFNYIIERIFNLPKAALGHLEPKYKLLTYRNVVGIADYEVYKQYMQIRALENPVQPLLPYWIQDVRRLAELRREKRLPAAPTPALKPLRQVLWEAVKAKFA